MHATDFHLYHKTQDPVYTTTTAFKARVMQNQVPSYIQLHTPPPAKLLQTPQYPDAREWQQAQGDELQNKYRPISKYQMVTSRLHPPTLTNHSIDDDLQIQTEHRRPHSATKSPAQSLRRPDETWTSLRPMTYYNLHSRPHESTNAHRTSCKSQSIR